ncbi:LuxR C-terminal-related transcriptional regulator [Microbacterium invictum]|uniref:LuxR C-terminal-related transcriptional regulator n=1 Tax=Microbacterium invictum TaxID=515415 RepID=A0ABZ0V6K4_9MICO|nr:LuxR C-terminal-related transcriptional regulator [Microbacterium invictum]WQB69248.1 LuxR C-terminal-related transcriptional regulator [Microbacterium invictum]
MAATYRWEGEAGTWRALPYLEKAEALIEENPSTPARLRATAALLRSMNERSRGDLDAAFDYAERTLGILSSAHSEVRDRLDLRSAALLKRGTIRMLRGEFHQARLDLEQGLRDADSDLTPRKRVEALGFLTMVEFFTGSIPDAVRVLRAARPIADRMPGGLWSAPLEIAELLIAAERGELARHAATLDRLATDVEGSEFEFLAQHLRILLAEELGDLDGRFDIVRRMRTLERQGAGAELLRLLRTGDRAAALLDSGDLTRANIVLRGDHDPGHLICMAALRARAALAIGDARGAIVETRSCVLDEDHPTRSLLASAAVEAEARVALGDLGSADATFRHLLRECATGGTFRVFRTIPGRVLARLVARADGRTDLTTAERAVLDVLAASLDAPEPDRSAAVALTPREHVVLARLAAGESPRAIAHALHVSLNTVKSQLRSAYRKLGATSKAGAVERAQSLGLLTA